MPPFFEEIGWRQLAVTLPFSNAKYHEEKAQRKSEQDRLALPKRTPVDKGKVTPFHRLHVFLKPCLTPAEQ